MSLTKAITNIFRRYLPSPFVIAILLSFLTIVLAWFFGDFTTEGSRIGQILKSWEKGLWNPSLLVFAYQMMLILVLGHVVVLSKPMERLIGRLTQWVTNAGSAALLVASTTIMVAFLNWGLALIFGAIMARKVGEHAQRNNIVINYPLVGACGYLGLLTYNGGISSSAAIKASEPGHITALLQGIVPETMLGQFPSSIPTSLTTFNPINLGVFAALLVILSLAAYYLARLNGGAKVNLPFFGNREESETETRLAAEKLDHSKVLAWVLGGLIFIAFFLQYSERLSRFDLSPNLLNFFMLGLGICLHGNIHSFRKAVAEAIGGTAGILIQFPLYFGIMGIMADSGLILQISDFFVSISNQTTYPLYTFISAGLVNLFIPSGGGQWAVQGPIILQAASNLDVSQAKTLMALAYGDQLTNMMQPFWALPLLGITRLKAREILPYTLIFMTIAMVIFIAGLLLW